MYWMRLVTIITIAVEGWWIFFLRARRARALAARARMFVTSRVPFFPNQQYEAVCTPIYTLN